MAAEGATPRWSRRTRNRSRPRARRLRTVTHRPTETGRGLLVGQALQVAEDDRQTVLRREPLDLIVKHRREVKLVGITEGSAAGTPLRCSCFRRRAEADLAAEATRQATPCSQLATESRLLNRAGPPDQNQERRLEGILCVVRVAKDAVADTQDHRPVPLDQHRERQLGGLITPAKKRSSN